MAKSTQYKVYDAAAKYAQLFSHNMDKGNDDTDAGRTVAAKGGQTKVTMVISEETKDAMIADGVPEKSMGYDMFKQHMTEEGVADGRWEYTAKRPWNSPFTDDNGEPQPFGLPNVVDYTKMQETKKDEQWNPEVNIGNGSDVKVKLSIYKNGNKRIIRLESVGVVNLVPYESSGDGEVRF